MEVVRRYNCNITKNFSQCRDIGVYKFAVCVNTYEIVLKTMCKKGTGKLEQIDVLSRHNEEINRQTRESLQQALLLLLMEKSMEKISVTELVKKAGVSRTAFYRNYNSKEEVLKAFSGEIIERIARGIKNPVYKENAFKWYLDTFTYILKHRDYATSIISSELSLEELIGCRSVLERIVVPKDMESYYGYLVLEGGFYNIISNWIRDGFVESPEDMALLCEKLLPKVRLWEDDVCD